MKYKVGDKVRVRKDLTLGKVYAMNDGSAKDDVVREMMNFAGKTVTIERANKKYTIKGCNYNFVDEMFEPVNTRKIVITSDGVETLARLYDGNKVVKTATAKCSPEDTFVFEEGARIALHRMLGDYAEVKAEKPHKYKAGDKVKVIGSRCCHGMKIGDVVTLDRVWEDGVYSKAWLTKEYAKQWYIRECDFEPYTEPEKKPIKIEVGKKYLLKPYDEVKNHLSISKFSWDTLRKSYVEVVSIGKDTAFIKAHDGFSWYIELQAFEKEYIEEKPFKFEVGKQYKYNDCVIEITKADRADPYSPVYRYKDVKGETLGVKQFSEKSMFANELTPYDPPKYYNGKVVCISNENEPYMAVSGFTVGKVYTITDGIITSDTGWTNISVRRLTTLEDVCTSLGNKFIPFVE